MSSHNDSFARSGNSPTPAVQQDCWLTTDGVVPIEKGKQHRDYFVPDGEKPSKQFGLDQGHVRVSTLGTNGSTLHFEFKELSPQTAQLIVDAVEWSRAELINLEFHFPKYSLRSNLSRQEAVSLLEPFCTSSSSPTVVEPDFAVENHGSIFLLLPLTDSARLWVDEHIGPDNGYQPSYPSVLIEHRFIAEIVRGAIADGLAVRG